jgi:hypothetical protein
MNAPDAVPTVQRALRRYWQRHPHAADTSAGIAKWWLEPPAREADVLAALMDLQLEGSVSPLVAGDGRVRWHWVAQG